MYDLHQEYIIEVTLVYTHDGTSLQVKLLLMMITGCFHIMMTDLYDTIITLSILLHITILCS